MHPLFAKADRLSAEVIGAAIEVHRIMGPGLLESIYERCLLRELELRGIPVRNQEEVVIEYKSAVFTEKLKFSWIASSVLLLKAGRHKLRCARSTERAGLIPIFDSRTNVRNFNCRLGYDHRLRFSPFRPRRGTAAS